MKKFAVLAALALMFVGAGKAQAFSGDWYMKGELERPSSPAFFAGFSAYDVDNFAVEFNNRTKSLSISLDFYEAPPMGEVIAVQLGMYDGEFCLPVAYMNLTSQPHTFVRQVFEPITTIVPGYFEYRYTPTPDGLSSPWMLLGLDGLNYKWSRWVPETQRYDGMRLVDREYVDVNQYERVGRLFRVGVDGYLEQPYVAANDATEMTWSFSHPRLDGLVATCVEIVSPNRIQRFSSALPINEINETPEDEVVVSARRKRGKVQLAANRGTKIAVRYGKKRAQVNRRSIVVSTDRKSVQVRVFTDSWGPWTTVTIKA